MEDPEANWKIDEYSSSSSSEDGKSNVKWILENGLRIGKKVMITGFVISSAPLVLPSIMVVSALGITVSVPFGLVFASYACTQKLLNKLLPIPTSSPLLEYDIIICKDEEEKYGEPEEEAVEVGYINMEEEEKERMEDIRQGVEKRIEMVKDGNELPWEDDDDDDLKDIRENDEERLANGEGVNGVDFEVFNEESKDEEPLPEVKQIIVVLGRGKTSGDDLGKSDHSVVVARGVGGESLKNRSVMIGNEQKGLKKESAGLLEKIRDDGSAGAAADEKKQKKRKKKKKEKGDLEKAKVQEKDDQGKAEAVKELESSNGKGNEHPETLVHTVEEDRKKEAKTNSGEDKKDNRIESVIEDKNKKLHKVVEEAMASDKTSAAKQGEPSIKLENIILEKRGEASRDNLATKLQQQRAGELVDSTVTYRNGVTREAADDLGDQQFSEVLENYQGNERAIEYIFSENIDLIEVPVTSRIPKQKYDEVISQLDTSVPSVEESIVSDNKIWEQIDALRTIVGYRATPQKSYIEEVKALYIFTGVEPPSSFERTTDIAELNEKLRFLMSIVGVK